MISFPQVYVCRSALHLAAAEGHTHLVRFMVESKANINCLDRWGGTPLSDAQHGNHFATAALLQGLGADPSSDDSSREGERMCKAAAKGRIEEIRRLVAGGASVNAADYDGRSALHLAAAEGHDAVVEYLVGERADVRVRDRWGADPLQDAVRGGHRAAQEILLQAGAAANRAGDAVEEVTVVSALRSRAGRGEWVRNSKTAHESLKCVGRSPSDIYG